MIPTEGTRITITFNLYPDGLGTDFSVLCDEKLGREERLNLFDLLREMAEHQREAVLFERVTYTPSGAGR